MKVLIADDNPVWTKLLAKVVERFDFKAVTTNTGGDVLKLLSGDDPPRIAFLDWQMPVHDGLELCRRIKENEHRPFTYIVILTSRTDEQDMIAGLDAGADDYLTKPVETSVVRSRLLAAKRIIEAIPPPEWSKPRVEGYEVQSIIGKGAFATVWRAKHLETDRNVALKLIRVDLATEQVFSRFAREIQVMRRMDHENVAHIYDAQLGKNLAYIAMELIEGKTFDAFVRDTSPDAVTILKIAASVCDGLHHAHTNGVVHRDLKPSNIMVGKNGVPKILDFGLCKSMFGDKAPDDSAVSMEGLVIGSPLFMAPEQARAENAEVDGRVDIFSLGVIIYMLLLRKHPMVHRSSDRSEAIKEVAEGTVQPPTELNPNFSKTLEKILLKALAREPDERYATAEDLGADLRDFIQRREKKAAKNVF